MSAITSENGKGAGSHVSPALVHDACKEKLSFNLERARVLVVRSVVLGCALYTLFAVHALAELYQSLPYALLSNALLLSFQGFYVAFALLLVQSSPKASVLAAVGTLSVVLVI